MTSWRYGITRRTLARAFCCGLLSTVAMAQGHQDTDAELVASLKQAGFTGNIAGTLETRLGRPLNRPLAELGRLLWFDKVSGLHSDNTCGGCHSPTNGFGDTQSI